MPITRRAAAAAAAAWLSVGPAGAVAAEDAIATIERRSGSRLGVFALDTGSERSLAHRADERFLMCSTFKGLLAAQVLSRVDAGDDSLTRLVPYGEADLVFTSPVTRAAVARGHLPVSDLCRAIVKESDNTAAILLMRGAGGPAGLTRFVRGLGDDVTRSDRYEPGSNTADGILDTTTPRAMVGTVRRILLGDALHPTSRDRLEAWMIAAKPGLARLRAAFPAGWTAADRPGTNLANQTNDVALARPPGRAPLLVAAYLDAPRLDPERREAVLREVGAAVVTWAG